MLRRNRELLGGIGVLVLLCLLAGSFGCASTKPEKGKTTVNTPFGGATVEYEESADPDMGLIRQTEFKDCLSRYERRLGSEEHETRAWCDCHIGQSPQWRGQQWQMYCGANSVEEPPVDPAVPAQAQACSDPPSCPAGQLLRFDDDGPVGCEAAAKPKVCKNDCPPCDKFDLDDQAIVACLHPAEVGKGGRPEIDAGKSSIVYINALKCINAIVNDASGIAELRDEVQRSRAAIAPNPDI